MNQNHNTCFQIYKELSTILSGCDTKLDAMQFTNIYCDRYPEYRNLILNMLNGYYYIDNIDQHTKVEMIRDMIRCESKDEGKIILAKIDNKTHDDVLKRTLNKILNRKKNKKIEIKDERVKMDIKSCPHCSHNMMMTPGTDYVICGYPNTVSGYDWNGCGKDWCFKCGKMLCKSWELNKLHYELNRIHSDGCCEKHARDNGKIYPEAYCQCNTMYVLRNNEIDFMDFPK